MMPNYIKVSVSFAILLLELFIYKSLYKKKCLIKMSNSISKIKNYTYMINFYLKKKSYFIENKNPLSSHVH